MGAKRLTSDESEFIDEADGILEGQFEDVSGLQDDLDGQLHAIFADVGGEPDDVHYEIRVYRPQKGKGALGYLFACLPAELPIMDKLRDEYGGGTFEVRVLKDKRIFRRKTVIVEPPLKKAAAPIVDQSASMAEVMAQGFTRLGELIVQSNAQQVVPVGNTMADMLQNMALMKQVMGEQAPQINPLKQLKDLAEIQSMMGGGSGDKSETNVNDVLLTLAETVLPKLAEVGAVQEQQNQGTIGGIEAENNKQNMPAGEGQLQAMPGMHENRLQNPTSPTNKPVGKRNPMKMHLIFLCAQAKMNRDPATYANMVLDNTPDEKLDELVEFMTSASAIDEMAKTHSAVANHREWFERLGKEILAQLIDTDQPEASGDGDAKEGELLTSDEKPANNVDNVSDDETAIDPNNRPPVGDTERQSGD